MKDTFPENIYPGNFMEKCFLSIYGNKSAQQFNTFYQTFITGDKWTKSQIMMKCIRI